MTDTAMTQLGKPVSPQVRTGAAGKHRHVGGKNPRVEMPKVPKQKFSDGELSALLSAARIVVATAHGNLFQFEQSGSRWTESYWSLGWHQTGVVGRKSLVQQIQEARSVYVGFGAVEPEPKPINSNQTKRTHAKRDEQGATT